MRITLVLLFCSSVALSQEHNVPTTSVIFHCTEEKMNEIMHRIQVYLLADVAGDPDSALSYSYRSYPATLNQHIFDQDSNHVARYICLGFNDSLTATHKRTNWRQFFYVHERPQKNYPMLQAIYELRFRIEFVFERRIRRVDILYVIAQYPKTSFSKKILDSLGR